jgi:outer membrane protein assembly factor BamB
VVTAPAGAVFGADATGGGGIEKSTSAATENNAYRTWTDASGKHQVVARQLAVDEGWVLLETENGKRIRVPVSQLSPADQAIIKGHAAHWPQFRGPNRDGKSPETGLLKEWPEAGPSLVRTISGVGTGFSSPVIAGERIYITGKVGDDLKIFCFDGSGKKIWERTHGPAFSEANAPHSPYPGSRAAPTIDGDRIYLLGGLGRLTAYRTSDGQPVWSVDVVGELGGRVPPWGYAESVLIDGDRLICTPGGEKTGAFAALDKRSGRVLWQSKEVTERAEYGSPIFIEFNQVRQIVTMSRGGLIAVSPENGKFLWQHNRVAKMGTPEGVTAHCNSPAYADGYVFEATSYHTRGGCAVALKPTATGLEAELAWENPRLNCEHGGYVIIDGYLYMNQGVGWSCLELKTGEERWSGRGPGKGSVIYADGMLYCLGEKGKMGLIEAQPDEFKLVSMFDLPMGEGPCWTHPVIADRKLYLRWDDNLYLYDIKE